ncbi:MAG: holo-ACP synthase [Alphaproteobacteria bacterium]
MILGIGMDLCDPARIADALSRHGDRFEQRCFTAGERAMAPPDPAPRAAHFARRFAAKEATAKALGTGFRAGIGWQMIEITRGPHRAPAICLHSAALNRLRDLTPAAMQPHIHLSLTDERAMAAAFVILEARPAA